ncbi:MAG: hypothetical protein WCK63_12495 [Betaproteobacteria bacterium]
MKIPPAGNKSYETEEHEFGSISYQSLQVDKLDNAKLNTYAIKHRRFDTDMLSGAMAAAVDACG